MGRGSLVLTLRGGRCGGARLSFSHCLEGFTLGELLSVLAILTILASLLLSSLQIVREKAMQSKCLQHEKELTAAVIQFSLDNEFFPHELANASGYFHPPGETPEGKDGYFALADDDTIRDYYQHQLEITRCPKVKAYMTDPNPTFSYGINEYIMNRNISHISQPSLTIVLVDSDKEKVVKTPQHVAYRHFQGANTAYADGHVQWEKSFVYIDYDKGHGNDPGGVDPDNPAVIKGAGAKAG